MRASSVAPAAEGRLLMFGDASSVHLQRWVAQMARRGFEIHVVTRLAGEVPGAASVTVVRPGLGARGWFAALPEIRRIARRLSPRWVHGHYVTSYGMWAAACGVHPVVLTAWGSDILVTPKRSRLMRALVGWTLRRADLITADSQDMLEEIVPYHPKAACHLVSWGADTEFFTPPSAPPGGFEIVSMRSWEPNYNIDVIVRAFARFLREAGQAASSSRLHLLGGGPMESALRGLARELGVDARVVFHGRRDDAGMREVLRASRVCVSVPTSDATSVSMLEAMACGLSLVASDLPANRVCLDAAHGDAGGVLVPAGDVSALAAALASLASDAEGERRMGRRNRAWVLQHANRQTHMDAMARLYCALKARA